MCDTAACTYFIDLDDTLVASSKATRYAMAAITSTVCDAHPGASAEQLKAAWTDARAQFWLDPRMAAMGRLDPRRAREITLVQALKQRRLPYPDVDGLLDLYASAKESKLSVGADTADVMAKLGAYGRLILVTNGTSRDQRRKLEHCGLLNCFDAVLIEEEVGVGKPQLYLIAQQRFGIGQHGSPAAVIGDDIAMDGRGAELAHLPFLHVASGRWCTYCATQPHSTHVPSLAGLLNQISASHPIGMRQTSAERGR